MTRGVSLSRSRSSAPRILREMRSRVLIRFALFAWLWATLLLPLAHTWKHQLDHVHGPFGVIPLLIGSGAEHSRFAGEHEHSHGHSHSEHAPHQKHAAAETGDGNSAGNSAEDEPPAHDQPSAPNHPPSDHGSGSAEHAQATLWFSLPSILPSRFSHFLTQPAERTARHAPSLAAAHWIERSRAPPEERALAPRQRA